MRKKSLFISSVWMRCPWPRCRRQSVPPREFFSGKEQGTRRGLRRERIGLWSGCHGYAPDHGWLVLGKSHAAMPVCCQWICLLPFPAALLISALSLIFFVVPGNATRPEFSATKQQKETKSRVFCCRVRVRVRVTGPPNATEKKIK